MPRPHAPAHMGLEEEASAAETEGEIVAKNAKRKNAAYVQNVPQAGAWLKGGWGVKSCSPMESQQTLAQSFQCARSENKGFLLNFEMLR